MADEAPDRAHWERVAHEWTAWARTPGHDAFWAYRASLAALIGRGAGEALEVGCGEGRVSRELKALGWRVTATDAVAAMVAAARGADSAADYAVALATALPFADGRFGLVVAYNVLMDVDDVPGAVKEMRRVMRPDGTLMVSIVHPFFDRGRFTSDEPGAPFVLDGTYFGRQRFEDTEERDGLVMHYAGWSQPLQSYAAALADAGLAITALCEPQPDKAHATGRAERWARVPLFLWLKARAPGSTAAILG